MNLCFPVEIEISVGAKQHGDFFDRTTVPAGSGKNLAARVTTMDEANIEAVVVQKGDVSDLSAPDKARILAHCYLRKGIALPQRFAIAERIAQGQAARNMGILVEPGLMVVAIIIQLAIRAAEFCTLPFQQFNLNPQALRRDPIVIIPVSDN